jgi:site-specific DNA recombinase
MQAFIYCRVSTDEQSTEDHYSLANQEQRARAYAKLKGWRIAKVRKDVGSGKDDKRLGFQELIADVRTGKVEVVVVYRLDRLSRNVRDIYDFIDLVRDRGVEFVSLTEGFDTTTAMGRAMLGVAAVFAQLAREMIAENVRDGLARRAESGRWNGPKWNPPLGYVYSVEKGELLPDPSTADLIRTIFRWFVDDKLGTMAIARLLNRQGAPKRTGNDTPWHQTSIWKIVTNDIYGGYIQVDGQLVRGTHEALISDETYAQSRELIAARRKMAPRTRSSQHLLSGLVRCAQCGRVLVGQIGRYQRQSGQMHTYVAFRHSPNEHVGSRHCPGVYVNAERLEEAVLGAVRQCARSEMMQMLSLDVVREQLAKGGPPPEREMERLAAKLAALDERFDKWAERLDAGSIDEDQFRSRNAVLLAQKTDLQSKLAELEARLFERDALEVSVEQARQALQDFDGVWDELSHEERREMLRNLIEDLKVSRDEVWLKLLFLPPMRVELPRKHARASRT